MENKATLLSTAPLNPFLINKALAAGLLIDEVPFIQVVDIADKNGIKDKIEALYHKQAIVVFTSANAVRAVSENPGFNQPDWDIYCIEGATKNAVLEYFKQTAIKGEAENAAALAHIIIEKAATSYITFFCGDIRLGVLPDALRKDGIHVDEVVVYETIEKPQFVEKNYEGILFFSPSAVSSYFNLNIPHPATIIFAIGNTTAMAIEKETNNIVITSCTPSKEAMVALAIVYFKLKK